MIKIRFKNIISGWNKIKRFGLFIPVSNIVLNYCHSFLPDRVIKSIFNRRNDLIERAIIQTIGNTTESDALNTSGKSDKIWVLWLQGESQMPLIPQMCLNSIRKHSNGHEVILLSMDNLHEYCPLSDRILNLYKNGNITPAHMSDIIRVELLCRHGGFWIDSTVYLTSDIPKSIFEKEIYSMKSEPEGLYVSECRWAGFCIFMKSSFILSDMLHDMLQRYWDKQDWLIDYFILDYLIDIAAKKSKTVADAINSIPYNNCHLHSLAPLLAHNYDEETFNQLIKDTSFFKLSWKLYSNDELLSNPGNFYAKLAEMAK